MTDYFRVTVEDLSTGEKRSMQVAEGDYMIIPFEPCYLDRTQRSANGTVQLTLKKHHPAGPPQHGDTPRDSPAAEPPAPEVCLGRDMDCGRALPCPDHPAAEPGSPA